MYFKYILFLTLVVASNGMLNNSLSVGAQEECTKDQFKCANGECTRDINRCDGYRSCYDGSDELNCTSCASSLFSCGDGKCIREISVCDLYDDCDDGGDENDCTNHVCSSDEFKCQNGQCIYESNKGPRCDGINHCADGSDEQDCHACFEYSANSTANPFKCVSNDKCISWFQKCDTIKDCPDGSDEDSATCKNLHCDEGKIKCSSGLCFHKSWFCQGYDPCGEDHKTEPSYFPCTECPSNMFKCDAGDKCIDNGRLCDTVPDCEDGSDDSESRCSVLKCGPREFQCQSGQCLDNSYAPTTVVCNGHYDCKDESDKSDEANCTICSLEAIKCGSGECVHKLNLCNSIAECADGSDENEINCPNGSTPQVWVPLWRTRWPGPTPDLTLKHLTHDLAVYFDSSVSPTVTWPFSLLSQAWKYAKESFELETLSEAGSQFMFVVIGKSKHDAKNNFSFRSRKSGYRNIIDSFIRERNGWVTQNSENFEKLLSGLGYIVKIAAEGVENNADEKLCYSTLSNIVFYDIYIYLKGQESADVIRWKDTQFNLTSGVWEYGKYNCVRDWYLPVYEKYGGATVLNNYFHIFKENWPKKLGVSSEFTYFGGKQLNVGEFVHFWSGAAGEDLRYFAKSAFGDWNDVFMRQFAKAQTDFPTITYPGKSTSGKYRNIGNVNSSDKSSSH